MPGISSKSSSSVTSTDNQGTSTTTPNVPQWGVDSLGPNGLNGMIEKLAGTDPQSFVTDASPLQSGAFDAAGHLGGWQNGIGTSDSIGTNVANAGQSSATNAPMTAAGIFDKGISQYLNPETDNVVTSTLNDFDNSAGQVRAAQEAKGAQAGAFGGSRFGLQEGETEGQLARARANTESTLRQTAFDKATGLANSDADRRQQAHQTNATLGTQVSEFNAGERDTDLNRALSVANLLSGNSTALHGGQLADIGAQADLGATQRDIAQSKATAPISMAQTIAALLGQNQLGLLTGQTTNSSSTGHSATNQTETPSTWTQIGNGIQTAANLAALFG